MGEIIIKGLIIGFLTSAPMGPIGVLCVQRTLNEGRKHGLFTGLGASLSDVIFAIIAGLGMGFVIDFIDVNRNLLFITGGLIMIVFGAMISRSNPVRKLQKQNKKTEPVWKDFFSSFFLNLSNIGILFLYIALFAQFHFITSEYSFFVHMIGILCIGVGAVVWWLFISYVVDKLREKVNIRALVLFNRILGVILIGIGIFGLYEGLSRFLM